MSATIIKKIITVRYITDSIRYETIWVTQSDGPSHICIYDIFAVLFQAFADHFLPNIFRTNYQSLQMLNSQECLSR